MLRRVKTWLQSRMAQIRLNSVSILYDNKSFLDDVSQPHVANGFVDHLSDRKNLPVDFFISFVFYLILFLLVFFHLSKRHFFTKITY